MDRTQSPPEFLGLSPAGEDLVFFLGFTAIVLIGFLLAIKMRTGNTLRLNRVSYFLFYSALHLFCSMAVISIFSFIPARPSTIFIILGMTVLATIAYGYGLGALGMARSKSAYDDSRAAWMAMIPLTNLFLFFKSPKTKSPSRGFRGIASNTIQVSIGFGIILIVFYLESLSDKVLENFDSEFDYYLSNDSFALSARIEEEGLADVLEQLADNVTLGEIDETLTLLDLEADAQTLRYVYLLKQGDQTLSNYARKRAIRNTCQDHWFYTILSAGGTIEYHYQSRDGTDLYTITVHARLCR
ncbi:MAG: hypothetical protein ACPGOY_01565 [Rhodospirillaceae bacterium]